MERLRTSQWRLRWCIKPLLFVIFCTISTAVCGMVDYKCPTSVCNCFPLLITKDFSYVIRVHCTKGGLRSVPVDQMDHRVSKLIISAPAKSPNYLTIGPIFVQPSAFSELKELSITNSNIPSIGHNTFWGLHSLKTLNLSLNNLTSIGKDNFRGLSNLTELYLPHNLIDNIPSETFISCTSLKRLVLSHNQITILTPRIFRMHGKLEYLELNYNPLQELDPEAFKDIQQLKIFKCRGCQIERINTQIYYITPHLEEIDLGYNLIKYFLADEFMNLKKLVRLRLDGNQLSVLLDNVFVQNTKMEYLNVASNRLAMISAHAFQNMSRLSSLDISYNRIDRFDLQTFGSIVRSIKSVNFSGNKLPLKEVALILQIIPDMLGVGLANLSLTSLPPNFFMHNPNLQELDLSWNKLTELPLDPLSNTMRLQRLDLSNNHLTALTEHDMLRLEGISDINLKNNMWHCDKCSAWKMIEVMNTSVLNDTLQEMHCSTPLSLHGIKLSNVTFDLLENCSFTKELQLILALGIVLLLVGALVAAMSLLLCTRHRVAHYHTHEVNHTTEESYKEWEQQAQAQENSEELLVNAELTALATIHAPSVAGEAS